MKNQEKHKCFKDCDLRDALAKELKKIGRGAIGTPESVEAIKNELQRLQVALIKEEKALAINTMIQDKGWQVIDVSDSIEDYQSDTYFNFVGTVNEAHKTFKNLPHISNQG